MVISHQMSLCWVELEMPHFLISKGWCKSCKADPIPEFSQLIRMMKSARDMKGYGLANREVKILRVGPTNEDKPGTMRITYLNPAGKEKSFQAGQLSVQLVCPLPPGRFLIRTLRGNWE